MSDRLTPRVIRGIAERDPLGELSVLDGDTIAGDRQELAKKVLYLRQALETIHSNAMTSTNDMVGAEWLMTYTGAVLAVNGEAGNDPAKVLSNRMVDDMNAFVVAARDKVPHHDSGARNMVSAMINDMVDTADVLKKLLNAHNQSQASHVLADTVAGRIEKAEIHLRAAVGMVDQMDGRFKEKPVARLEEVWQHLNDLEAKLEAIQKIAEEPRTFAPPVGSIGYRIETDSTVKFKIPHPLNAQALHQLIEEASHRSRRSEPRHGGTGAAIRGNLTISVEGDELVVSFKEVGGQTVCTMPEITR